MDSLLCLPNEVILGVSTYCEISQLSQLVRTCWRLHYVLNPQLYRRVARRPLLHASEHNKQATIQRALQYTIPKQHDLSKALALACRGGHAAIVRLLLAWGASPNGLGYRYRPPLAIAAVFRRLDIIEILLSSGARPTGNGYNVRLTANILSRCTQSPTYTDPTVCGWRRPMDDPRILQLLVRHGMRIEPNSDTLERALQDQAPLATISVLLDLGLDPNQPRDVSRRPLQTVIQYTTPWFEKECLEVIHKCVQHGVDINARLPNGGTVLHMAAAKPMPDVVRALIAAGADVNVRNNNGRTPLNVRHIYHGDSPDVPRVLLEAGADMTILDNQGEEHVLQHALDHKNKKTIKLLLDHGLELAPAVDVSLLMVAAVFLEDVSAVRRLVHSFPDHSLNRRADPDGNTPLHRAARDGLDEIISTLLLHSHVVDTQTPDSDSALHAAMRTGKASTARLLMHHTPSNEFLNTRNTMLLTPLSIAVQIQPVDIIETLLDKGCSPLPYPDCQRETLLHHAVRRSDPAITKLLLERGAARGVHSFAGETAFGIAIRLGREDLVQRFLEDGESLNDRNGQGNTALMVAVLAGSLPLVTRLVAAGAELEAENDSLLRQGSTALMMAMDAPKPDIAQFLFDSGASAAGKAKGGKTLLVRAIQRKWPALALGMLKRHGSALDLESLPSKGIKRTALSWAACLGYVDIVRELLRLGANPVHCDPDGRSALYWATYGGNMEVISSVVERMQRDGCVDIKADILEEVARHRRDTFKP